MLARRLPGILPPLSDEEAVEVALIHSAAGRQRRLTSARPFRSPHHTASRAALVGGGSGIPVPGEVSLAHRGVMFLDELAEFPRSSLDTLRQPLEDGFVTVARRGMTSRFPSRFQMVAASNPCPCGFFGDRRKPCGCRPAVLSRYRLRASGPLVDRIDLVIKVGRIEAKDMRDGQGESSAKVRSRVKDARAFREDRTGSTSPEANRLIHEALEAGLLTARGAVSIKRVARTIADLSGEAMAGEAHVAEAIGLRGEF